MFTGLIEEVGECLWLRQTSECVQLTISAKHIEKRVHRGDSIAVNGCCLTVTSHRNEQIVFDLLEETQALTNLRNLRPGHQVNLERAMKMEGRFGGHFVQGHIDCSTVLLGRHDHGSEILFEFSLPPKFACYIVYKGSIAINGVSLTVAELKEHSFSVWVIPHTAKKTNLGKLAAGDEVNLEFDLLAKYAERILRGTRE